MTRKEYEEKYGSPPPVQTPTAATSSAPVKMTALQYRREYGKYPPGYEAPDGSVGGDSGGGIISTFTSNLREHFNKRVDLAADAQMKAINSEQSLGSGVLQTFGQGAAFVGDVGLEVLKAAVPKDVEDIVAMGLSKVGENKTIQDIAEGYNSWKEDHPEAAANLEGVVNIAGLLPVGKIGTSVTKGLGKTASFVTPGVKVAGNVATAPVRATARLSRSLWSSHMGVPVDDIKTIMDNPSQFSKAEIAKVNRESILDSYIQKRDKRRDDLNGLGSMYEPIRKGDARVTIDTTNWIAQQLDAFNIKLKKKPTPKEVDEDGIIRFDAPVEKSGGFEVLADTTSRTRDAADIRALNKFVDDWSGKAELTGEEFLNMRSDLAKLSKLDRTFGKSEEVENITKKMRESLDVDGYKDQLPGLRELDEQFAPELKELEMIDKDIFNQDGSVKDGAANKLANAIQKGKGSTLERMLKNDPALEHDLRVLSAIESIQSASGFKIGSYTRAGTAVGAMATGFNPMFVVSLALSFPEVAVPLMRGLGYSKQAMAAVGDAMVHSYNKGKGAVDSAVKGASDALNAPRNNIQGKDGGYIMSPFAQTQDAASIAGKLLPDQINTLRKFVDNTTRYGKNSNRLNPANLTENQRKTFELLQRLDPTLTSSEDITRMAKDIMDSLSTSGKFSTLPVQSVQ